jgi:hypothetical protein
MVPAIAPLPPIRIRKPGSADGYEVFQLLDDECAGDIEGGADDGGEAEAARPTKRKRAVAL